MYIKYMWYNFHINNYGKHPTNSIIGRIHRHSVMDVLEIYINNVEEYGIVMPPVHRILKNTYYNHTLM